MVRFFLVVFFVGIFTNPLAAQWTNGQAADVVIGQANMTSNSTGTTSSTLSMAIFTGGGVLYDSQNAKMYIFDTHNNRVLRFSYPVGGFSSNQPAAEAVLGQANFVTGATGTSSQQFVSPVGGAILDDTLWVADFANNRVLGFYNASTKTNGAAADVVLGHSDFTTSTGGTTAATMKNPSGVAIDPVTRDIYVVEFLNHRVLKFLANNKSTGASAGLVFGQANFTTGTSGTSSNQLSSPWKVLFNNNNLFVVDYGNNRVVRFNNARSISSNQPTPDVVFGQPNLSTVTAGTTASKLSGPTGVVVDGAGRLYISDQSNCRVVIYPDAFSSSSGPAATNVIGQTNFTSLTAGTTSTTLNTPDEIGIDVPNKKLFVVDALNNRVMQYTASTALPVEISSFTAAAKGSGNQLAWTTSTEVNNYGFDIERRIIPVSISLQEGAATGAWKKLGFVVGAGTSNSPKEYTFTDNNSSAGRYSYRLKQIDRDGKFEYSRTVEAGVQQTPSVFSLMQNYPNPFNPSTQIEFSLITSGETKLSVHDLLGREVAVLLNERKEAGSYSVAFDAGQLSAGIYYYTLRSSSQIAVKKMSLLK